MRMRAVVLSAMLTAAACAPVPPKPDSPRLSPHVEALLGAAEAQTRNHVVYDPAYVRLAYPMGDVPADRGVCTDVVVRAYRAQGIDLQRLVHEDMRVAFSEYPTRWGLPAPDPNIDHRRVLNLQVFLRRQGASLGASDDPSAYLPGDLVTWNVDGTLPHIGIVTDRRSADGRRPLIVHNIGAGVQIEDMLFDYPITGRFRWAGPRVTAASTPEPAVR